MKHHVERTSPKGPGLPFIGTCRLCGMTGLKASAALEYCENVRGLSFEEAIVETISGYPQASGEGYRDAFDQPSDIEPFADLAPVSGVKE